MKLFKDKKKVDKIASWKRILNAIYTKEEDYYNLPCPSGEDYDKLINVIYYYEEDDTEYFIKTSNLDTNKLVTDLKITSEDLKKGLQFITRNELIIDPSKIIKNYHESSSSIDLIPLILTKKGFDVALENEKHKASMINSTLSVFLTVGYVIFTIAIAFYYLIQLRINANQISSSEGADMYLIIMIFAALILLGLRPTMKKFQKNF